MYIFQYYKSIFEICINNCIKKNNWPELALKYFNLEPPRSLSYGDIATAIPLIIAKSAKQPPAKLAEELAVELKDTHKFSLVSVSNNGFVNVKIPESTWMQVMQSILNKGTSYGYCSKKVHEAVNIEFVSANPTGPLHVAHARGAIIGDVLANILKAVGANVTKEYYINDSGSQIDTLAHSLLFRLLELKGEQQGELPENCYPGEYLIDVAKLLQKETQLENIPKHQRHSFLKQFGVQKLMEVIKNDLKSLNVGMDIYTSELKLIKEKAVEKCIESLKSKKVVYEGRLPKPEEHHDDEWEEREQLLFKAKDFGDDKDRPLQKSDGSWTYFAGDIAYHLDKINRLDSSKSRVLIDIVGADHSGYISRISSAVKALTDQPLQFKALICQIVRVVKNGKISKMSKRSGNMVTIQDLLQELDVDVLRFHMLMRSSDSTLDIDIDLLKQNSRDNPVYYVQYAHARICSLRKKATEKLWKKAITKTTWPDLKLPIEKNLLHLCSQWPRVLEMSAQTYEPHRIGTYLYKLSSLYHQAWSVARTDKKARFIDLESEELTLSRLALSECVRIIIASGLKIMGVSPRNQLY